MISWREIEPDFLIGSATAAKLGELALTISSKPYRQRNLPLDARITLGLACIATIELVNEPKTVNLLYDACAGRTVAQAKQICEDFVGRIERWAEEAPKG